MAEYYEMILRHRVHDGGRHDLYLEPPIVINGFISPLMQKSMDVNAEHEALIDEMCHKIKEYWMQTRKDGEQQ